MAGVAVRVLISIALLGGRVAPSGLDTSPLQTLHTESERYSVDALDTGGSDRAARVIVSNHVTSRKHMVMVNSTLGELKRAVIREDQDRITLVCTKGFAVLDPAGVANTDEVYGLDAVLSPDGRWIAYRRFFPITHPGPSDGVVLYDTARSREQNHSAYPIAAEREWRAGTAVFPAGEEWKDANAVVSSREAYVLTSPISWEGDRAAPVLLFSMRRGDEETVVIADVTSEPPRACWAPLRGGVEAWRVKTMTYKRSDSTHVISVTSSAHANPAETTVTFPAGCSGEAR